MATVEDVTSHPRQRQRCSSGVLIRRRIDDLTLGVKRPNPRREILPSDVG
jgi:hypothetical protein